jgi:hypothetical protein
MGIESSPKKIPLSKDEAQKEAGMLRAQMDMIPATGKIATTESEKTNKDILRYQEAGRNATREDYDQALAALEELKVFAEQEPATTKVLGVFARLSVNAAELVSYVVKESMLTSTPEWHDKRYWGTDDERAAAIKDAEQRKSEDKTKQQNFDALFVDRLNALRAAAENPSYKLRKLEKEGEQFDT